MGQILLNGMNTGGPGNPDTLELDKYPDGHLCAAINLRASIPVTVNGSGGSYTGVASDVRDLMLMAIGSLVLRDGTGYIPYPTVPGDELRTVHRYLNLNEVPNDIIGTSFTKGASVTVHFDLRLRAGFPWLSFPHVRLPGPSQMRASELQLVEGSTVPTNFTRGAGLILWDVDVETVESDQDQYAPFLGYFRDNQSRLYATSPDGLILGAWDINNPFASTALDLFTIGLGNEETQLRRPYMVADAYRDGVVQGGATDFTDTVTPVYVPTRNTVPDQLPHGRLTFRQATQYLSTIKLRGMFWPSISSDAAANATIQAATHAKTSVHAAVAPAANGGNSANPGAAATRPLIFSKPTDPAFTLKPGIIAKPGGTSVQVSVPPSYKAAINAQTSAAAKDGTATAAHATQAAASQLGKLLPGFSGTNGAKAPSVLGLLGHPTGAPQ